MSSGIQRSHKFLKEEKALFADCNLQVIWKVALSDSLRVGMGMNPLVAVK